jgi:hypothetical protein
MYEEKEPHSAATIPNQESMQEAEVGKKVKN